MAHTRQCNTLVQKKSNWDAPPDAALAAVEPTANNPQLTFKARRIYVGNLPTQPQIDDKQLREFFDQVPLAAMRALVRPVRTTWLLGSSDALACFRSLECNFVRA